MIDNKRTPDSYRVAHIKEILDYIRVLFNCQHSSCPTKPYHLRPPNNLLGVGNPNTVLTGLGTAPEQKLPPAGRVAGSNCRESQAVATGGSKYLLVPATAQ